MKTSKCTREIYAALLCDSCKDGKPCEHDCVLSGSCSFNCDCCGHKMWFIVNSLEKIGPKAVCHHCGYTQSNWVFKRGLVK